MFSHNSDRSFDGSPRHDCHKSRSPGPGKRYKSGGKHHHKVHTEMFTLIAPIVGEQVIEKSYEFKDKYFAKQKAAIEKEASDLHGVPAWADTNIDLQDVMAREREAYFKTQRVSSALNIHDGQPCPSLQDRVRNQIHTIEKKLRDSPSPRKNFLK